MSSTSARVVSILLALGIFSILPVSQWGQNPLSPITVPQLYFGLALSLITPLSLFGMWLLLHHLVRTRRPELAVRNKVRAAWWLLGPPGCVWAVFYLTNPELTREPQSVPRRKEADWRQKERMLGLWLGIVLILIELVMAYFLPRFSTVQYLFVRMLSAGAMAGFALFVAGVLNIRRAWIRATSAFATFGLVYLLDPSRLAF